MSDTVIPKGSLVLVTGANGKYPNITLITIAHILWSGYIGSHIVDILLSQGYQVRGTARSTSKLDGLKALWAKKYPRGHFEVTVVEDMGKDGAFDDAVKGSSSLFAFFNIRIDISLLRCVRRRSHRSQLEISFYRHRRNRRPHRQRHDIHPALSSHSAYHHSVRPNFIIPRCRSHTSKRSLFHRRGLVERL